MYEKSSYKNRDELYNDYLKELRNIKFTPREIDIIACILHNRGEKKIASLLSISPRTVGVHVHNVMGKLGNNSRDYIIDFIENSGKLQYVKYYYTEVLIQNSMTNQLLKVKSITDKYPIKISTYYNENELEISQKFLIERINNDLKSVNVTLSHEFYSTNHSSPNLVFLDNNFSIEIKKDILALLSNNVGQEKLNNIKFIDFRNREDYVLSVITLIEQIVNKPILKQSFENFRNEYCSIRNLHNTKFIETPNINNNVFAKQKIIYNKKIFKLLSILIICVNLSIFLFREKIISKSIRTDLEIPQNKISRVEIINKIDKKLGTQKYCSNWNRWYREDYACSYVCI